jgi:hypothetical protein
MGFFRGKNEPKRTKFNIKASNKTERTEQKTARSEQVAWRKWGEELHRTCKYRFTPHLRQAAPDHLLFLFFLFFLAAKPQKSPPSFFCRKAAMFQKTNPAKLRGCLFL